MFCDKCGSPLNDGDKFCTACGNSVKAEGQEQQNYWGNSNPVWNGVSVSAKPKSRKPLHFGIIAVVVVVSLLTGSYFTFGKNLFASPARKTFISMAKVAGADAVDSETVIKLKLNGASGENLLLKSIADDLALKINSKSDKAKSQGEFKFSLVMKKQTILDVDIYANQDIVVINSQGLLDKPLYLNTKDVNKLTGQETSENSKVDLKKYESFFKDLSKSSDYKAVVKKYSTFFEDVLGDFTQKTGATDVNIVENGKERTIKCDETTVTIDENFVKKVVKGLLERVSTDNKLKALVKDKVNEFYKLAEKNGDLEKFQLDSDTFKESLKNFDTEWDKAMEELKSNLDNMDKELSALKLNSTAKFKIDSNNRLRQLTYDIDGGSTIGSAFGMPGVSGSVVIETTFNAFNGDVKLNKPSTDGAQNMAEMDQYELMDLMGRIQDKLQNILGSSLLGGM